MTLVIKKPTSGKLVMAKSYVGVDDPDAAAYIAAVEAADGQSLETAVKVAIHSFVKGCKADGIWPAIKASCILAGARTINGALVPLAGAAPTNFNFVAGDYNRKTGLVGNGTTKYLNSNRNSSSDPQNNCHFAVYHSQAGTTGVFIGGGGFASTAGVSMVGPDYAAGAAGARSKNSTVQVGSVGGTATPSLVGMSRATSSQWTLRGGGVANTFTQSSQTPEANTPYAIYEWITSSGGATAGVKSNARLAFYSIGESLDLALLDARVTDLINAIGAANP